MTTKDIAAETAELKARGVKFRGEPKDAGPIMAVLFEDGCGNLVNLVQPNWGPASQRRKTRIAALPRLPQ